MTPEHDRIAACILRLRHKTPFFGALALFTRHGFDESIPTACTDGVSVLFHPAFAKSLRPEELDAVMVHELLHAALLHCGRRGTRDPHLWNIAADIVVNGMIRNHGELKLPHGTCMDRTLENHEVEEVYQVLLSRGDPPALEGIGADIRPGDSVLDPARQREIEAHWRRSLHEAAAMARMVGQGNLPAGLQRLVERVTQPQIDWRNALWQHLAHTPVDFTGFDRRFIGRGLHLETLDGESVAARIAIDTSSSISPRALSAFLGEVREILRLYPHIDCELYYADAELHGPFPPGHASFEAPIGGGGTSFRPFFQQMRQLPPAQHHTVLVYLTDGYGTFPAEPPGHPVLWVVTPGGLPTARFPFGTVVRLVRE